jgi:RNAse (barnase) inhibitor barstar
MICGVAAFDPSSNLNEDMAFRLMRDTPVTMFWRRGLLDDAVGWLEAHGYRVVRIDASGWTSSDDMHRDVAKALEFPDYYGNNLNAFNDCLRDIGDDNLVLVCTGYDRFAKLEPQDAHGLLDVFAGQARGALLFGGRWLCLVQSDDPDLHFPHVGATPVLWNDKEWLNASRHGS